MRQNIEPISGSDLALMGDDEVKDLLAYWKIRTEKAISEKGKSDAALILISVEAEKSWRDRIRSYGCKFLTYDGVCRHSKVVERYGAEHVCPKMEAMGCTLRKMSMTASFGKKTKA